MTFDSEGIDGTERLLETGYVPRVKGDVVVLTSPTGQSVITLSLELYGFEN
jgi:hypothetical protein